MNTIGWIIVVIAALGGGGAGGYFLKKYLNEVAHQEQQLKAESIVLAAQEKAHTIELQAKDEALSAQQAAETELGHRRAELSREDDRLLKRRTELDHRMERLELREQTINKRQGALDKRTNDVEKMFAQQSTELQRVAQMTVEEARGVLLAETEKGARADMARIIRQIEAEAREEGETKARELIADAIQRVASDHVAEVTTSIVPLPNEEMKGRIVGRNGRNIRAFEQAAGVDVIVDDTPEAVTISCFDPVRREVARRSLARLILDGRIHPAHIEKVLAEEEREVEHDIIEAGEQAAFEAGVAGLHPEILKTFGRLKYRTSYGQNQLRARGRGCQTGGGYGGRVGGGCRRFQSRRAYCTTWARLSTTIPKAPTL